MLPITLQPEIIDDNPQTAMSEPLPSPLAVTTLPQPLPPAPLSVPATAPTAPVPVPQTKGEQSNSVSEVALPLVPSQKATPTPVADPDPLPAAALPLSPGSASHDGPVAPAPPEPTPSNLPEDPTQVSVSPEFPHLETSTGCQIISNCWRSPTSSWRSAMRQLQAQLEDQGYELQNVTGDVLSSDTGVQIYAVLQEGAVAYYLNLVSVSDGVLYTMTAQPMTQDEVNALERF
jgi:hypothetical protein